ncbi:MAG: hypothetical protein AAGI68_12490 [Planctomycetota bacterium]
MSDGLMHERGGGGGGGDALDAQVVRHFERQRLDDSALEGLRSIASPGGVERAVAAEERKSWSGVRWLLAAIVLLMGGGMLSIAWMLPESGPAYEGRLGAADNMRQSVAAAIALNHRKDLASEFEVEAGAGGAGAAGYAALNGLMPKLDFVMVPPEPGHGTAELVGGRYCSIKDHIAVQLRLVGVHGERQTLYQFADHADFAAMEPGVAMVNGVRVQLWRQSGLIFGLARSAG